MGLTRHVGFRWEKSANWWRQQRTPYLAPADVATRAVSLSSWLDTKMYSLSAIETAPAITPASPAVKIGARAEVAPAAPPRCR
jgi:hypothetical protein